MIIIMMMGAPRFRPPEWATLLPPKAFGEALLSPSCRPTPLPQLPLSFCSSARCERARARRARDCERLKQQQQQQQQQRAHVSGLSWIMYVSGGSWGISKRNSTGANSTQVWNYPRHSWRHPSQSWVRCVCLGAKVSALGVLEPS